MKVINMFGGPGTGKSTTAASVFAHLKQHAFEVELVTEYAKQLTWENRSSALSNQVYVFAKQLHNIHRLLNKVPLVVTDAPLLLSLVYKPLTLPSSYDALVLDTFNQYENINILLKRTVDYNANGRNQTLEEAITVDTRVELMLQYYKVPYVTMDPLLLRVEDILALL